MVVQSVIFDFPAEYLHSSPNISQSPNYSGLKLTQGCFTKMGDLESADEWRSKISGRSCPFEHLDLETVSIWEFNINLDPILTRRQVGFFDYYNLRIVPHLYEILKQVTDLRMDEPGREVIIKLVTRSTNVRKWDEEQHLFCDDSTSSIHLLLEAIATWASIHEVRIILKPAFDTRLDIGWWSLLGYTGGQFAARNYPQDSNFGGNPCIPWENDISLPMSFKGQGAEVAGLTLNMGIRSYTPDKQKLNVEELKMMTLFGLHVSPTLEILTRNDNASVAISDLDTIREMVSDSSFATVLGLNNITNGTIFINIPAEHLLFSAEALQNLFTVFPRNDSLSGLKIGGIHITIGKTTNVVKKSEKIVSLISQRTKFGVAKDCRLDCARFTEFPAIQYFQSASYFVGQNTKWEQSIPLPERSSIQEVVDSQLRDKRILRSRFPNLKTIIFRQVSFRDFDVVESEGTRDSNYLRLISHLNAFRKTYNISNFVSGFGHDYTHATRDNLMKFEIGWWNISNYSDLSDISVYSEKQSNHLQLPSWRPLIPEVKSIPWTIVIVCGVAMAVVIAIALGVYRLVRLQRKIRLLTKKEVREFYDGSLPDTLEPNLCGYLREKFSASFEIPKSELNPAARQILGSGNFGIVYKATVKDVPVAVKVPHDSCTKEIFRSMLFEVKILSYLGAHSNIVEFVGCYTKEIADGVIFIATKLCERGCLKNHLTKDLRTQFESTNDVRMGELFRFSFEIANGMEYIRTKNVVHGDLSTRNVLLDGDLTCKIADFGLSRKLYEFGKYVKAEHEPLPWRWMAYETLVDMEFTSKSDVWSYGVTLWEIFSLGATPYPGLSWSVDFPKDLSNGLRLNSPEYATEDVYVQLGSCWNLDPATRPGFEQLGEFFLRIRNQLYYSEI